MAGIPLNGEVTLDEINARKESVSDAGPDIVMGDETRQKIRSLQ